MNRPARLLNAFRRHRRGHAGSVDPRNWLRLLNAFRRHRRGHVSRSGAGDVDGCSTPFGVIVDVTRRPQSHLAADLAAQRLSASSSRSRRSSTKPPPACCSTPFGVIVDVTQLRPEPRSLTCSTPFGVIVEVTPARKPWPVSRLLNAFRRHRRGHRRQAVGPRCRLCSTPFGVIVEVTCDHLGTRAPACCSTPFGVIVDVTGRGRERSPGVVCSTPFGVIVEVTPRPERRRPPVRLLNAFRRHRRGHFTSPVGVVAVSAAQRLRRHRRGRSGGASGPARAGRSCSTPFGVIVEVTRAGADGLAVPVCSTPFGVIVEVTPGPSTTGVPGMAAQRLSASSSRSRSRPPDRRAPSNLLLNALRRHRRGHSRADMRRTFPRLLNAFRRHRRGHASHAGSAALGVGTAQRLSASSSWSPDERHALRLLEEPAQRLSASS